MFQTGGLIVFCGLLAQATALLEVPSLPVGQPLPVGKPPLSLPNPLPVLNPTDLAGSFTGALSNGLLSGGLSDKLKNLPLSDSLRSIEDISRLQGKLASLIPFLKTIDAKLTNPYLLKFDLEQSADGHKLYINIPTGMTIKVNIPLIGTLLKLDMKMNITAGISAVRDEQGKAHLVLDQCIPISNSVELTLLDGVASLPTQNNINNLIQALSKVVPEKVLGKVCPLVQQSLNSMDVTIIEDLAGKLINGMKINFEA